MVMYVKSFTVSHAITSNTERDGRETDHAVVSRPGFTAELMLLPNSGTVPARDEPKQIHISVNMAIDQVPNLTGHEYRSWIRDQLVDMLADRTAE